MSGCVWLRPLSGSGGTALSADSLDRPLSGLVVLSLLVLRAVPSQLFTGSLSGSLCSVEAFD
jgi:hypothetical protein